jgi:hypothetical protein
MSLKWSPLRGSALIALLAFAPALAQDNDCDPGEEPDVIVGAIFDHANYGTADGATGFAIGTESCNIGSCELDWLSGTPFHPVIAQNMFRLMDGRFTQVGVGWLKHGFATLNNNLCGSCVPADGQHLGVNCSDPYWATLNGSQTSLGPRFEVNATQGTHLHPYTYQGQTSSDPNYKRLSVRVADLDPNRNPGALWFVEGQYVTEDDAAAGNHFNNSSYRQIFPNSNGTDFSLTGPTFQMESALWAWQDFGNGTVAWIDPYLLGGYEVLDLGDGFYRYEYAIQNVNSDRSVQAVKISLPHGVTLRNVGFADADYHSGEPYDGTDWAVTHEDGESEHNYLEWSTDPFEVNPDANALRWGTVYSFWFEADVEPTGSSGVGSTPPRNGELLYFKPGPGRPSVGWQVQAPERCGDSFCDVDENQISCSVDCAALPPAGEVPDGHEVAGPQLMVMLEGNGELTLDWGPSCISGDGNYGVYEGFIGDFNSHTWRTCSTAGLTNTTLSPSDGGTYYLVVPNNEIAEGSYGFDSAGNPRPPGQEICFQQSVASCP